MQDKHRQAGSTGETSNKVGIQCANGMRFIKAEGEEREEREGREYGWGWPGLPGWHRGGREGRMSVRQRDGKSRCVCNYRDKQRQCEVVVAHTD